jgi:ComEC/Rec2-related protein
VLLNFPISLERAFLFVFILFISGIFFRKSKSIDLLLLTGFFIAMLNPENLKTISFQLSFSAVFGILLFKENLDKIFFGKLKNIVTENFSISLSAMIGTYLVLIFYFKSFSFGSLLINFCIVPIASILLPLLYLTIFIGYLVKLFEMIPFLEYMSAPFWYLSNQLIEFLAYLSILFSEKISFQKESSKIDFEIYFVFFVFLLFLIGLFFLSEIELKKKKRFFAILISLSSFFTLGIFLSSSYYLFDLKNEKIYKTVFASYDYYLLKEKNSIYLGGSCKYSKHQLQKNLNRKFCKDAEKIHIEQESCLSYAFKCNQYFQTESKPKLYSIPTQDSIDEVESVKETFPHKFDSYFFYYPNKDSLSNLIANTKEAKGKIIIFFPYKSKDNAKDWNQNKNLLGISPNWNFITFDEL